MRKQNNQQMAISDSNKKLKNLYQEEENACKAFHIDNFYSGQHVNILELKKRIELFKRSHSRPPPQPIRYATPIQSNLNSYVAQSGEQQYNKQSTAKFRSKLSKKILLNDTQNGQIIDRIHQKQHHKEAKQISQIASSHKKKIVQMAKHLTTMESNKQQQKKNDNPIYYRIKQKKNNPQIHKNKTIYRAHYHASVQTTALQSLEEKGTFRILRMKTEQKGDFSKVTQSSVQKSWDEWGLQHSILISQPRNLLDLQHNIQTMWDHYQLLSRILIGLKEGIQRQKSNIAKYIEEVCSNQFQFIKQFLNQIGRKYIQNKKEVAFIKRLKRAVLLTRLLENIAIVLASLEICIGQKSDSNLVNFVGYSTSNIVFIIRLLDLCHEVSAPLAYSSQTQQILSVIQSFEVGSYGNRLRKLGEMIIRIEQNNQIINIVLNKLTFKMNKQFQLSINNFLKKEDLQMSSLLQYAHYLFQFLASYLAKIKIHGKFPAVQIAPLPYLAFQKGYTVVVEPWEVLFATKGKATFVRAYTEIFLTEIARYCRLVYWTDQLPQQIDDLFEKLPKACVLYRYHCRYENGLFVKQLQRMGCDLQNTIIIDRSENNFRYNRSMGLQMPWRGMKKDKKLMILWQLLHPILQNGQCLRKSFESVKSHLAARMPSRKLKHIAYKQLYTHQNERDEEFN